MFSVLIVEDVADSKNESGKDALKKYVALLKSYFNSKNVLCQSVNFNGLQNEYSLLGKTKENIIYLPQIEFSDNKVSFVLVDSVSSLSPAFKIASIIQKTRFCNNQNNVLFINKLKDSDPLRHCSPLIVDTIRLNEYPDNLQYEFLVSCASSVVYAVCKIFDSKIPK